jgi:hypothetical protein
MNQIQTNLNKVIERMNDKTELVLIVTGEERKGMSSLGMNTSRFFK